MQLTDILSQDFVVVINESKERDQCIKELIDLMAGQEIINDRDKAYEAVLEREKIMTTGVGNGIAIPHCKHASCPNFAVALGIYPKGVDFKSIDKKEAKIVFLLVGPENNPGLHIKLLSRISRLMSDEDLRQQILKSKDAEEILGLLKEEESYYFDLE